MGSKTPLFIVIAIFGVFLIIDIYAKFRHDGALKLHEDAKKAELEAIFSTKDDAELTYAAATGDKQRLEQYLSRGVKIDCKGKDDLTPLALALMNSNREAVSLLLEHGANPNLPTYHGLAPVHMVSYDIYGKDPWFLEQLLKHGGDPNLVLKGAKGEIELPVFMAIFSDSLPKVKLLVQAGAKMNVINVRGGETPFTNAIHNELYEMVYYFLQEGFDPTIKDDSGHTIVDLLQMFPGKPDETGYRQKIIEWLKAKNLWHEEFSPQ